MSGTLYVVATPIGNLEDITLRALRLLREARVIAAEDTRRTARLLSHHGIATPTLSFHAHNTRTRLPQIVARLKSGDDVALVTDAGTPGISDPGTELVEACIAEGITVEPIPGPSAPLAAALASGFPLEPLTVYGFPPSRSTPRKNWLQMIASIPHTVTFFEAPHRIRQTLAEAVPLFGERPIVVARELTKIHEEFLRGTAAALLKRIAEPQGEYTVVLGPLSVGPKDGQEAPSDRDLATEFYLMTHSSRLTRREAIKTIAKKHHRSARDIYAALERSKISGE
jgi:16S rRNA (cytidine1402-2'-O)-methyltransferase